MSEKNDFVFGMDIAIESSILTNGRVYMLKKMLSVGLSAALVLSATAVTFGDASLLTAAKPVESKGHLVIVGGALGSTNAAVYNEYIKLAGGKEQAKIGIIPAASGNLKSSNNFKNDLKAYGVPEANVVVLPLAVVDDSKTKDVDESKWIENASKAEIAAQIKGLNAIWFVGGDQTRITKALLKPDGSQSEALKAIWEVYLKGGVIGGTSAGAAIMSSPMLAGGNSLGAITEGFTTSYTDENDQLNGPVYMENGLGFFGYGLVDQHFDARARLGRLAVAAYTYKSQYSRAYGIDENTAMVFHGASKTFEVAGAGGVTVVDTIMAQRMAVPKSKQYAYKNLLISFVSPGDTYKVTTGDMTVSSSKDLTNGYEYYDVKGPILSTGVFSGYNTVKEFVAYNLVDNAGADKITSYCFDENGLGAQLTFSKNSSTKGYWGYQDGNMDSYSAKEVTLDIEPIEVSIKVLNAAPNAVKK